MRYFELTESRADVIGRKFKDRLLAAFGNDPQSNRDVEPNIEYIMHSLTYMDPTKNQAYLQWIVNQYIKGDFFIEDAPRVRKALVDFHQNKSRLQIKDITRYKKLSDVEIAVEDLDPESKSKRQEKQEIKTEGADIIYKGSDCTILELKTKEAACYYGRGTKWCTAATEGKNYFDSYKMQGPLYVLIGKDNRKYQIQFESSQFMDERDDPVEAAFLMKEYKGFNNLIELTKKRILSNGTPGEVFGFIRSVIKKRWPPGEAIIVKSSSYSLEYAAHYVGGRWKEAEPNILHGIELIAQYAARVVRGRWPKGEKVLLNNLRGNFINAIAYARSVIRGRWPELEKAILKQKNKKAMINYTGDILKRRWIEAEDIIKSDPHMVLSYIIGLGGATGTVQRAEFRDLEPYIVTDPEQAFLYARTVILGRWKGGEQTIMKDPETAYKYAKYVIRGPWPEAEDYIKNDWAYWVKYRDEIKKQSK